MTKNVSALTSAILGISLFAGCTQSQEVRKPNIIYILADDLGYGDLSCYGQQKFQTPNIDNLAAEGMKFTQHYCGSAVCAPSRSSLMTGQHTGHTPIRGNKELEGEGQVPMAGDAVTVAEVLKSAGYVTGAFGKWGLGFIGSEGDANNQGFDEFFGYNCQRMAHRYYPTYLWHNNEKVFLEGNDWTNTVTYSPEVIQQAALKFIEDNKDNPFFAYVPYTLPHAELISPTDSLYEKFDGKFVEDQPFPATHPYASAYGPDMEFERYCPQDKPYATYATMIVRMDSYVGQIVDKLEELGIADNTIVLFASDNGPCQEGGANPKFFDSAGGFKGIKRDLYEGGIRSPFIVKWPAKVKAGTVSDQVSAFWDMLPTFAELAGAKVTSETDGISLVPTLLGKGNQEQHKYLYWEFPAQGGRVAVRMGDWKGVVYNIEKEDNPEFKLFNLKEDMTESNNVADEHPDIVTEMKKIIAKEHQVSDLFPMNLDKVTQ